MKRLVLAVLTIALSGFTFGDAFGVLEAMAREGNADAQALLGIMYAEGKGVPKDVIEAYGWFNISAAQGDSEAIKNRDLAAKRLSPADLSDAQDLSRKYYKLYVEPFQ